MFTIYKGGIFVVIIFTLLCCFTVNAKDIEIYWHANDEADLQGYHLYYGTASQQYFNKQTVEKDTSAVVPNLQEKTEYYFSLTAFDAAGNESDFSKEFVCIVNDTRPLLVENVTALCQTGIAVRFNKKVSPASAQTVANYTIKEGGVIYNAQLLSDGITVHLVTSPHQHNVVYNLNIKNIDDISLPANTVQNHDYTFQFDEPVTDYYSPAVTLVAADSADHIIVYFSKSVKPETALNILNYAISDQITINSAAMYADNAVSLQTSAHEPNRIYTITVNNVTGLANTPDTIADNSVYTYHWMPADYTSPVIILAHSPAPNELDVLFSEPLQDGCVNTANFRIDENVQALTAQLDSSRKIIHLQTTKHQPGINYVLYAENILNLSSSGNAAAVKSSFTYQHTPNDVTAPFVKTVTVLDETHINIYFSEKVTRKSAEQARNYIISNGVQVLAAELALSEDYVCLTTTPHQTGVLYTVSVVGVQDRSLHSNEIAGSFPFYYTLSPDHAATGALITTVDIPDSVTINITFNKALDQATAENSANYTITGGPSIISIALLDSANIVQLKTTPHRTKQLYSIRTCGIYPQIYKNNTIIQDNLIHYEYQEEDRTKPLVIQAKAINDQEIQILFSEAVERGSAEKLQNYQILENIAILAAQLDGSKRIVRLQTNALPKAGRYTLKINNIRDDSPAKNACPPGSQYSFLYTPGDRTAPYVKMVTVSEPELIRVHFSEAVNSGDALQSENYVINNGVKIHAVHFGLTDNMVELITTPLAPGISYNLKIFGVRDLAENMVPAQNSFVFQYYPTIISGIPQLTGLAVNGAKELRLEYDQPVIPELAQNKNNYHINHQVTVHAAQIQHPNQVKLSTSAHVAEAAYILETRSFNDENLITPYPYTLAGNGYTPLKMTGAELLCADMLQISFNYPVDRQSATNLVNYTVTPAGNILSASLEADEKTVILTTDAHFEGIPYTIAAKNIKPKGTNRAVEIPLYSTYTYLPSLGVYVRCMAKTNIEYLQPGKEYYTDSHYITTAVPKELINSRLIKTPNSDKNNKQDHYLSVILTTNAVVYIAYDSRAKTVPVWLTKQFTKTDMTLGVTESGGKMILWKNIFPAGEIVLGGNKAGGAVNASSMYLVIIQAVDPQLYEKGANSKNKERNNPGSFTLFQNYPNPFNPETTIPFEITNEMLIKLEIYDILGRKIKTLLNSKMPAGYHSIIWDGRDDLNNKVATGVYFYKYEQSAAKTATSTNHRKTLVKKMLLVK